MNRDLLLESEKEEYFFRLDEKELIKRSIKERYEVYEIAQRTGINTINELRQMEGLSLISGGDVLNVGLSAVLFDINTGKYFTPNTNSVVSLDSLTENVNDNE